MAGVRCIEEIIKTSPDQFDITIIGSEPHPNYNRILLSKVLQGDTSISDITLNELDWYAENNITLHKGETATKVDTKKQTVTTDKQQTIPYDHLIFATGSMPFMLPLPGADKDGVMGFRDIKDCDTLIHYAKTKKKAVVIGGGILGLEAARGLLNLDMDVTVVHNEPYLMNRQLDPEAGKLLKKKLEEQGMKIMVHTLTQELTGKKHVSGLKFVDGSFLEADLVIMAVGIKPQVQLARDSGLSVNNGIVVDDYMRASAPNVYALGECTEHRKTVYGLVAPLYDQGKVLAKTVCGVDTKPYEGSVLSTNLKVSGVSVFSTGTIVESDTSKSLMAFDDWKGTYKKVLSENGRVTGAVLFGDTSESTLLTSMINKKANIEDYLAMQQSDAPAVSVTASMSAEDIICGCNGVTKGTICSAIKEQGLASVEEVKACTSASRSCGGCANLVADLLQETLGDSFDASNQVKPLCSCTTMSRDEIVDAIREQELTTTRSVMNVLDWKTEEGCSKCRPALNYYINMAHPTNSQDEKESKYVNERLHANIQKDGTFSVVPRMYGGVTNADQLRKIADVADKYEVKLLKVTGGQRIDMFGLKKDDLPSVWEDLDMPSGYAYGKTLRTVKTCVGADFCRFGTQDSIGLGVELEKRFERVSTPHKVKMAVSACPRNCAESGIKDVGIVGVDGGWEIYVGGNGGTHLRAADLLVKVKSEQEVLQITGAYFQYYRETAEYLERTAPWVERLGLDHIRDVVTDPEQSVALIARLDVALAATVEPWKQVISDAQIRKELYEVAAPALTK